MSSGEIHLWVRSSIEVLLSLLDVQARIYCPNATNGMLWCCSKSTCGFCHQLMTDYRFWRKKIRRQFCVFIIWPYFSLKCWYESWNTGSGWISNFSITHRLFLKSVLLFCVPVQCWKVAKRARAALRFAPMCELIILSLHVWYLSKYS